MSNTRKIGLAVVLGASLALTGCGNDDDADGTPTAPVSPPVTAPATTPPAAINDSVGNFIAYLVVLVGQVGDGEPLNIAAVTPPVSDTADPTTLP